MRQADDHWVLTEASGLEATIAAPALQTVLALSEVYARVDFELMDETGGKKF